MSVNHPLHRRNSRRPCPRKRPPQRPAPDHVVDVLSKVHRCERLLRIAGNLACRVAPRALARAGPHAHRKLGNVVHLVYKAHGLAVSELEARDGPLFAAVLFGWRRWAATAEVMRRARLSRRGMHRRRLDSDCESGPIASSGDVARAHATLSGSLRRGRVIPEALHCTLRTYFCHSNYCQNTLKK